MLSHSQNFQSLGSTPSLALAIVSFFALQRVVLITPIQSASDLLDLGIRLTF
jgi:hypothetical protein